MTEGGVDSQNVIFNGNRLKSIRLGYVNVQKISIIMKVNILQR